MVDGHDRTDFWIQKNFWFRPFFDIFSNLMDQKNASSQKSCLPKKISFFMPVNHVKEYLISVHTSVVFSHFYVRASNGSHYSYFGNKCPKLGTDTPEDMLFTNLAEAT